MNQLLRRLVPAAALALAACSGGGGGINPDVAGVTSFSVGEARFGQPVLITLNGRNLNLGFQVRANGCLNLSKSTTAPNISTDTTAYFTCTPQLSTTIHFIATRDSDGVQMADVPITVLLPTVTSSQASAALFGQPVLITLNGTELQQTLSVSATGCGALRRSTTAPYISTETVAYYRCIPTKTGEIQFTAARSQDGVNVATVPFTVPEAIPVPEVTFTVSNGAGVSGDIVITLEAAKAPITVGNFLEYVIDGFYRDTVFHRRINGFVIQGGGYAKTLDPTSTTAPTLKPTYPPITLEDDKGLLNLQGTLSMARTGSPNSATSQFFINLADNPSLDRSSTQRGYAVFGRITAGSELVTAMTTAPCSPWALLFTGDDPTACLPSPNLVITNAVQTR